jgi:DNA-binding CsgD family transcriptional regulator
MKAKEQLPTSRLASAKQPDLEELFRQFALTTAKHSAAASLQAKHTHSAAGQEKPLRADDEPTVLFEITIDDKHYAFICHQIKHNQENERIRLSPREQEIVRLIAKGLPNKSIAAVLDISIWTVSTHVRRIFAKLHASSRAEVVAQALAHVDCLR